MYQSFNNLILQSEEGEKFFSPSSQKEQNKLLVEIGFGNGAHLVHLASLNPNALIVGIEVSQLCVFKAAKRISAAGLDNCKLILGDARYLLTRWFAPHSIDRVIMNFPCPWPKKRHISRRVTSGWFAALLSEMLKKDGVYELNTDVEWYASEAKNFFTANGFELTKEEVNPTREFITKYETKWKEMGRDTYSLEVKNVSCINNNNIIENTSGVTEMTMTANNVTASIEELMSSLEGEKSGSSGAMFVFGEYFISKGGDGLLSVITSDEGFEQHFFLRISKSKKDKKGVIGVRTEGRTSPYRTPAVKASIEYVCAKAGS